MKKIILWFLYLSLLSFGQINSFHTNTNLNLFANYLFCQKDYLRAIEEFKRLDNFQNSDTILFKIGYSYFHIGDFDNSEFYFNRIQRSSTLKKIAVDYNSANYFLRENFSTLRNNVNTFNKEYNISSKKLLITSMILYDNLLPTENEITIFNNDEKIFIKNLIQKKSNPDYRSPHLAGILSLIPGLGKIYTKNYSDGLTSFLLTGLFTFLSVDNFRSNHKFRGYVFSLTALGFYFGNIYGSILSAEKYNHNYDEKLFNDAYYFIKQKNYFLEDVNFCN